MPDRSVQQPPQPPTFAELGVAAELVGALADNGIERVFSIQELTLPIALTGRDLIGQARTGMGKTLAFGVPLLDRVFDDADIAELDGTPRALVITPTRELAVQVGEDLTLAAKNTPVRLSTIYGGRPYDEQLDALHDGVDVVVGTPGRLLDLHQRGDLDLSQVAILVLDEADEMLDLGFLPDIQKLWGALNQPLQTMLFSATMPGQILTLARSMMNKPLHIRAEATESSQVHDTTKQVVFCSHKMDKPEVTVRILQASGRGKTIIFTRTKRTAAEVAEDLAGRGFAVGSVHGDLGQEARERSLDAFRHGDVEILVATDVAARGIDVDDVTHVINYQTPDDPMTYVHRIGRTGRAGRTGTAVTLVGFDEGAKWKLISDELSLDTPEPPTWFSTSPELREALGIPDSASSTVGPARSVHGTRKKSGPQRESRGRSGKRPSRSRSNSRRKRR
ncbi:MULTISPECIES: DEAD/DEAH box helicase [unclassified Corynebacterium]|uniref:DEAD/DEAH box helicase n=1 Tax=unclassified Corynebacterium TaxID=2624378 RepID=UPI0026549ABD|nr:MULTISPECIES: DEAD/DEAH box helicase [unclassified Corynebacterium]MDN8595151.1 DEAD/DEAH box helicase [Corynebacterium sp. P4_F2]WKK56615.1 DEAD/DEAH box helicase [Corynebacterium sp. P4-C1]WKK64052.1 DEAD/DEAH box helicase [Corynebacterium sp. P8-C1]